MFSNHHHQKKIIYVIIFSVLLTFALPVLSFADSGTDDINVGDMSYYSVYEFDGQNHPLSVTREQKTVNGVLCYEYYLPETTVSGAVKGVVVYDDLQLKNGHEYNLKFKHRSNYANNTLFTVSLVYYSSSGAILSQNTLYIKSPETNNTWYDCDTNFTVDTSGLSSGYKIRLELTFSHSINANTRDCVSTPIYLNDLNDYTSFFQSIINWLQNIANGLSNLASTFVNSISSLGNNLNTWLTGVKDGIVNKLTTFQTSVNDAISGIQTWFVNLGNEIGQFFNMLKNYLLYFQHPVTLNADGVPVDSNGNPVYTNPFSDKLSQISSNLDDLFLDLDDFILSINSVNQQITSYLTTFTSIFNRFSAGVPIFATVVILGLAIIVIRKVIGR